jgi:hypothetical protein
MPGPEQQGTVDMGRQAECFKALYEEISKLTSSLK